MSLPSEHKLTVPFELLLKKLNLRDYYDLKQLLRANSLHLIPNHQPVSYSTANQILQRLRGIQISRKELRDYGRPSEDSIAHKQVALLPPQFEEYASKLFSQATSQPANAIRGVGIQGGYFAELDQPIFFFEFKKGVHFLIGDRGSGKSTILNAAAASLGRQAAGEQRFIARVLIAMQTPNNSVIEALDGVSNFLREYGATHAALYYQKNGNSYCFYVSRWEGHGVFQYADGQFRQVGLEVDRLPDCQIFRQGDIFRIAVPTGNLIRLASSRESGDVRAR